MFGYACNDNAAYLPAPIYYAHEILKDLKAEREITNIIGPDAKSQVSVQYEGGKAKRIDQVVISTQHSEGHVEAARDLAKQCAMNVLGDLIDENTVWHLNPTGNFVIGGPDGDAGVTGRKIIVDTYGGFAPTAAERLAVRILLKWTGQLRTWRDGLRKNCSSQMKLADWCNIQLSYAIGH